VLVSRRTHCAGLKFFHVIHTFVQSVLAAFSSFTSLFSALFYVVRTSRLQQSIKTSIPSSQITSYEHIVLYAAQLTHQTPWSRSASSAGPRSHSRLPSHSLYPTYRQHIFSFVTSSEAQVGTAIHPKPRRFASSCSLRDFDEGHRL